MHAIVFDIDGTLLDSEGVDGKLFLASVKSTLGVSDVRSDWTTYRHVSDQGILIEIMEEYGIRPEQALIDGTKNHFIGLLEAHIKVHGPFCEIPGARDYISRLIASEEYYVAYATGAWHESALIKLKSAGFPVDGLRIATASECADRVSIMKSALSAAPGTLERITYFGDGVWDQAASEELGWEFLPVGKALGGIEHYYGTVA